MSTASRAATPVGTRADVGPGAPSVEPAGSSSERVGPSSEPVGALGGVMAALAWLPRLVGLHLGWVALVVLGGVVGGIAPATATMLALLRGEDLRGQRARTATDGSALADRPMRAHVLAVLHRFRRELVAANLAAGPFVLIASAAALNVALGVAGALPLWFFPAGFAASLLLAVLATLALFHALALHALRPVAPAPVIWRGALAGPILLPVATLSWGITLTATVIVSLLVQPVGLLMAGGILVTVTSLVLVRSWQSRLDAALAPAGPARAPSPRGGAPMPPAGASTPSVGAATAPVGGPRR